MVRRRLGQSGLQTCVNRWDAPAGCRGTSRKKERLLQEHSNGVKALTEKEVHMKNERRYCGWRIEPDGTIRFRCVGITYSEPQKAKRFYGCSDMPIVIDGGDPLYAIAILERYHGCWMPISDIVLIPCRQQAYETAILRCCRDHGLMITDGYEPGRLSKEQKSALFDRLAARSGKATTWASVPTANEVPAIQLKET